MKRQKSLANAKSFEKHRVKQTRREKFLAEMDKIVPWKELCALIEPFYPTGKKGRPPVGIERMLRIHFLQQWFNLSDPAAEEALYDMESMRRFAGIDLGNEPVPDETTICKFRHLLEAHDLGEKLFKSVSLNLQAKGLRMSEGTIMDATIISAPSSTKNNTKTRDPEMHQTRKGNQWYFGMKAHIGVDAQTGTVHSLVTTPANVHDSHCIGGLLHGKEQAVWGDSAYFGKSETIAKSAPHARQKIHRRGVRGRKLTEEDKLRNRELSRTRVRVEHVFGIVKNIFGFVKVRYKGLAKNTNYLYVSFALANLYMVRKRLLEHPSGV
jgi:IS5 family transposase